MAKILLTGMAGFIGYRFARTVADTGIEIVGIDNLNPYYSPRLKLHRLADLGFTIPDTGEQEKRSSRFPDSFSADAGKDVDKDVGGNIGGDVGGNIGKDVGGNIDGNVGGYVAGDVGGNIGGYVAGDVGRRAMERPYCSTHQPINSSTHQPINSSTLHSKLHPNLRFMQLDIADAEALTALMEQERFTHVVHLAAQAGVRYSIENPQAYQHSNLQGFLNILEGCRAFKPQHLIYASSSSVYGANNKVPFAESDRVDTPVSLYAATKRSNELMACAYSSLYGLRVTGLRFFTVYGPWGRPDMAPFIFAKAIMEGKPIRVFNHGNMSRDFTYVDDIIEGMRRVVFDCYSPAYAPQARNAPLCEIYNIGHGKPVALSEFIATLERLTGREAVKQYVGMQPGDVPVTYADTSLLAHRYGYSPQTSLSDGLTAFVEWLQTYPSLHDISPTP